MVSSGRYRSSHHARSAAPAAEGTPRSTRSSSYCGFWGSRHRRITAGCGQAQAPSLRQLAGQELLGEIIDIHTSSGGTYRSPRVHAMLARRGISVGRKRVERLMRGAGLQVAFLRKKWRLGSIRQDRRAVLATDLVNCDLTAGEPDRLWVADATRIVLVRVCSGWPRSGTRSRTGSWVGSARTDATPNVCSLLSSTRCGPAMFVTGSVVERPGVLVNTCGSAQVKGC
ncbi:IS3 family transposase [Nocardia salmonicida]